MESPNKKILALDDEKVVLESVSRILEDQGYDVATHSNGHNALEAVRAGKFDLFITDLKMPDMDGLKAIKEVKSIDPHIPVVVITAHSTVETAREALKLGASDYIKKPFTPDALVEVVGKIILHEDRKQAQEYRKEAFEEVKKAVATSLSLRETLDEIVKGVVKTFRVKGATVSLLDKEKKFLRVGAYHGLSHEYVAKGPLDSSSSIGEMLLRSEPVLVPDATHDSRVQYPREAEREGVKSILSVPLFTKDHIIGALRVYTSETAEFEEKDIRFLQGFAEYVSLAIENARKYEDVKGEYNVLMDDLWDYFDVDGWL
jgi:CheY-like chemotaxis protein